MTITAPGLRTTLVAMTTAIVATKPLTSSAAAAPGGGRPSPGGYDLSTLHDLALVGGLGSVWSVDQLYREYATLRQIDPRTNKLVAEHPLASSAGGIVAADGSLCEPSGGLGGEVLLADGVGDASAWRNSDLARQSPGTNLGL